MTRRERILAAAMRAARTGLENVTVSRVARLAGCTRPTVYVEFPKGKPALLEAVRAEAERVGDGSVVALFILTGR